jgi:diguanylate cyclase (GGDEF)-like protein
MTGAAWGVVGRAVPPDDPAEGSGQGLGRPAPLIGWFSLLGGVLGTVNLGVEGVLRPGAWTVLYALVMASLVALGVGLLLTRTLARALLPLVVLNGHLVYVVVSFCVVDAERYSTPLMLLFSVLTGSLVLGTRTFVLNCLLVVPVLAVTMAPRYDADAVGLVVQVAVHSSILVITAIAVFLLRRRAEHLLERTWQLSRTDELTGLPNRRMLTERATELVARARRSGRMLAVLVLDVDRFKAVNDEHGHAVGDAVLREVGRALLSEVRADELAARTGGEEVVVVACVPDVAEATRLAQRLQAAVRDCPSPVPVTCSMGLAVERPPAGVDAPAWVWHRVGVADGAMYRAKQEGRDRVVVDATRAQAAFELDGLT